MPTLKAARVGARLNSALARQTREKKAVEAADKMFMVAQQKNERDDDGTGAGEHRGESREKEGGVTMMLELLRPHLNSISTRAMVMVARMEDEVKLTMQDVRPTKGTHVEEPPGIQQTQLDVPATNVREIASQAQARQAIWEGRNIEALRW